MKFYYEGWESNGEPIVVGHISQFKFKAGEDPNSVLNSNIGGSMSAVLTMPYATPASGFTKFWKNLKVDTPTELYGDSALKDGTGVMVTKDKNDWISFKTKVGNINLGGGISSDLYNQSLEMYSIYDGETYADYLKSVLKYEQRVARGDAMVDNHNRAIPAMSISYLSSPFLLVYKSTVSNDFCSGYPATSDRAYRCFATLYKAYTGKNVIEVDKFISTKFADVEPAVAYDPRNVYLKDFNKSGGAFYEYKEDVNKFSQLVPTISNAPQNNVIATKDVVENITENTKAAVSGVDLGSITMRAYVFIQAGTKIKNNILDVLQRLYIRDAFDDELCTWANYSDEKPFDNPRWCGFFYYAEYCILQTVPLWNVSRELKANADYNYGLIGPDGYKVPLYVLAHTQSIEFKEKSPYNIMDVPGAFAFVSDDNKYSHITGANYSAWFFNGEVVDPGSKPIKPPDVPVDNGNGGFNNNDHLGGDGVWSDSTTDMTPDRDNPLWNIPNSLGLDGNYDIVKLSRSSLESLASQTWTEKGWLSYLASFSPFSRASDGVANVKTCFADIPSTGNAQVAAVAGFRLKDPIPCNRINQYNEFDMGTVDVPVYFGSYLDYSPYTEIVLELPFAQPVTIPPEVVVGQSIGLKLYTDVMSDSAMYIVHCNGRLIAQVPANIFISIPFASSEYSQSALNAVSEYIANAGNIGVSTESLGGAVASGVKAASGAVHEITSQSENRKITQISQGGGPGAVGAMTAKYAVLKISRPYVTIPPRYYELNGCPSGFVKKVGDCGGYLEVGAIYGNIKCNTEEFSMITDVLAGGVYP